MKYRQESIAEETFVATTSSLKVEGTWLQGIILDEDRRHMPFPCEVKQDKRYIIEVAT